MMINLLQVLLATMTGGFKVSSAETSGSLVLATVLSDFSFTSAEDLSDEESVQLASTWTFTSGQLSVVAEDGSEVVLDADSGDAATAKITIKNDQGEQTFDQPWSIWTDTLTGTQLLKLRGLLASR